MRPALVAALLALALPAFGATPVRETAVTADGVTLVLKRYRSGGNPVILCHGIVQNDGCMDLPVAGSSFAQYLAARGWDVWVANLRSHGKGTWKSGDTGRWDWSIDQFAALDVPAIVAKVTAATGGKKPFWVGHSMGGMSANGYLQGVKIQNVKVDEIWGWGWCGGLPCYKKLSDVYGPRVVRDAALGAQRNAGLRGLVTIGTPVKLKWRHDVSIWNYWLYDYWDYNLVVNELANNGPANDALRQMSYLPFGRLQQILTDDVRNLPWVGNPLWSFLDWVFGNVGSSFLTAQVWNPSNMNPTIASAVIDQTLDDTESRVCQQFLDSVRNKTWREYYVNDRLRSPYVYANNYAAITTRLLQVTGTRDKMCNDDIAYYEGFLKFGSGDRTWRDFSGFGHDDLVLGVQADDQVYPFVHNWMRAR